MAISACGGTSQSQSEQGADAVSTVAPLGPEPTGSKALYPVVFANGIIADGSTLAPVLAAWQQDGHAAFMTHVPAANSVETRTASLKQQVDDILASTNAPKVNLIAYSMGALDVRYLVSHYGYGPKVASITFLSGVNEGTPACDRAAYLLSLLPASWEKDIESFVGYFGTQLNPLLDRPELLAVAQDMSVAGMKTFAQENADDDGVYYQSYASLSTQFGRSAQSQWDACGTILGNDAAPDIMNRALTASLLVLAPSVLQEPSDGIVPVENQKHGTFLGCVPTDHWGIIGSSRAPGPDPRTGFDIVRFYRNLVFDLAKQGY